MHCIIFEKCEMFHMNFYSLKKCYLQEKPIFGQHASEAFSTGKVLLSNKY